MAKDKHGIEAGDNPEALIMPIRDFDWQSPYKKLPPAKKKDRPPVEAGAGDVTPPPGITKPFGCGGKVKMAKGGSVCRGGGAATRGTKFSGVK